MSLVKVLTGSCLAKPADVFRNRDFLQHSARAFGFWGIPRLVRNSLLFWPSADSRIVARLQVTAHESAFASAFACMQVCLSVCVCVCLLNRWQFLQSSHAQAVARAKPRHPGVCTAALGVLCSAYGLRQFVCRDALLSEHVISARNKKC